MLEKYLKIRRLSDIYYDVQDVRMRTANRLRTFPLKTETTYPKQLQKMEYQIKRELESWLETVPIYKEWLAKIRGIGPCLSGGLIGTLMIRFALKNNLEDVAETQKQYTLKSNNGGYRVPEIRGITAFSNVSSLWKYCGQHVINGHAPKRRRGKHVSYSPKMRTLCWKIGESFVKCGDFYREQYEYFRRREDEREYICEVCKKNHPKAAQCIKGHRYARAKRLTVKMFLAHLFEVWYALEGVDAPAPYAQGFLGHDGYVEPPHKP